MGENLKEKELKKVIKAFDFIPSFNRIIVTVNREEDSEGIITTEDALSRVQYVVARGETSKYEAGDRVMLDFDRLTMYEEDPMDSTKKIARIKVNPFVNEGRVYTIIFDNDVLGKFK